MENDKEQAKVLFVVVGAIVVMVGLVIYGFYSAISYLIG